MTEDKKKSLLFSIIIPAYNEARHIISTLSKTTAYLNKNNWQYEIIVVNDGSRDATLELLHKYQKTNKALKILTNKVNQGKGYALKKGILNAQGDYILFLDADFSTSIEELSKFLPWLKRGYEIVVGTRKMPGARIIVHQPFVRHFSGRVYTWLADLILSVKISDVTCGFKCFQKHAAHNLFSRQRITGWGFDAEIFYLAKKFSYRIKEVPVIWHNVESTKVRLLYNIITSFIELLQVRFNDLRGYYLTDK